MNRVAAVVVVLALAGMGPGGVALSAPGDTIGTLVSVTTTVSAGSKGAEVALAEGAQLRSDERLVTDVSGIGQIEFVDHTKLAIGPGSTLTLDRFVYDPVKSKTDIVIGFGQGAFRFITGAGSHEGYQIVTPSATIAVRGTAFDVAIDGDGEIAVAMIEGEVQVCSRRTLACRLHNAIGQFLNLTPDGVFALRDKWDATLFKGIAFAKAMPFIVNDDLLRPTFRAGGTVVRQYASAAGVAIGQVGQTVGQAAKDAGQTVGQAAQTAGQAAKNAVQAPVQVIQSLPRVLPNLNPFRR